MSWNRSGNTTASSAATFAASANGNLSLSEVARQKRNMQGTLPEQRSYAAERNGMHATVYEVRRKAPPSKNTILDYKTLRTTRQFPFEAGSEYKGEWNGDRKEGFGIQINTDDTKYEGEWQNGVYHGRGTLWVSMSAKQVKGKKKPAGGSDGYTRQYVGIWMNGKKQGDGVFYYPNGDVYRGHWIENRRSGEGRYEYSNGDVYVGQWLNDMRHGPGMMNFQNGNVYDGSWENDLKVGPGVYYYASTKKIYEGEWVEDQPQCGCYRSPTHDEEIAYLRPLPKGLQYNDFQLPELGLADANGVLNQSLAEVRGIQGDGSARSVLMEVFGVTPEMMAFAVERFVDSREPGETPRAGDEFEVNWAPRGVIHRRCLVDIFDVLGVDLSSPLLQQYDALLSERGTDLLSFDDVLELTIVILTDQRELSAVDQQRSHK